MVIVLRVFKEFETLLLFWKSEHLVVLGAAFLYLGRLLYLTEAVNYYL